MRKSFFQFRGIGVLLIGGALAVVASLALRGDGQSVARADEEDETSDESKIRRGFELAPVELNLEGRNRALLGLGSYMVNAQFSCSECHTWPNYAPGGNPFLGQPEEINTAGYLAGGRPFGPFVSRNLTPDPETGLPAGMTFDQFDFTMRSGTDLGHAPPYVPSAENDLLQVMPWPVYHNMTDRDMRALYEYLRSIPSVP